MDLIKHKLKLSNYDKKADNVFPSAILTLVSIIQGVAFYILVDKTLSADLEIESLALLIPHGILSLANLAVVAFEYMWFVGMFTGTISIIDISLVFFLGIGEIAPMYNQNDPKNWWILNSIFYAIGIFAFTNSLWKASHIEYDNDEATCLINKTLRRNLWFCAASALISTIISYRCYRNVDTCFFHIRDLPIIGSIIILGVFGRMMYENHVFLQEVRKVCWVKTKEKAVVTLNGENPLQ